MFSFVSGWMKLLMARREALRIEIMNRRFLASSSLAKPGRSAPKMQVLYLEAALSWPATGTLLATLK